MAELIDKKTIFPNGVLLLDENNPMASVGELVNRIANLPTTTEAEIRAKAIDEFAEKLKDFIAKQVEDAESSNDLCTEIFQSEIDEIAEQLKEEQE
jgi:hypothetical protein